MRVLLCHSDYTLLLDTSTGFTDVATPRASLSEDKGPFADGYEPWKQIIAQPPKHLVWIDQPRSSSETPCLGPSSYASVSVNSERCHIYTLMLIRRIYRHIFKERAPGKSFASPGALAVLSILPAESDTKSLHDAMIDLYASFPSELKPFDS